MATRRPDICRSHRLLHQCRRGGRGAEDFPDFLPAQLKFPGFVVVIEYVAKEFAINGLAAIDIAVEAEAVGIQQSNLGLRSRRIPPVPAASHNIGDEVAEVRRPFSHGSVFQFKLDR
jgi:hypothetical protein